MLQSLKHLHGHLLHSSQNVCIFLALGSPATDTAFQKCPQWCSPSFDLLALLNAAQGAVVLLCCKTTMLAHVQVSVHQDTQVLFWKAPLQIVSLHPRTARLFFLGCHFSLLNFRRFLLAQHFSSISLSIPLNVSTTALCINHYSKFCITYKPAKAMLCTIV